MIKRAMFIILILLLLTSVTTQAMHESALSEALIERALFVNRKMVIYQNDLNLNDAMTLKQVNERVNAIFKYAREYNHLYSDADYIRVAINVYSIVETETRFVNYISLDDGMSFGVSSIRWDTIEFIKKLLNENFENNVQSRNKLRRNTDEQIRLMTYYYYYLLIRNNGDFNASAMQYNIGHNGIVEDHKWRNYTFLVKGRVDYLYSKFNIKGRL